jgi:hypothetical protein
MSIDLTTFNHLLKGGSFVLTRWLLTLELLSTTLPPFIRSFKKEKVKVIFIKGSIEKKVVKVVDNSKSLISLGQNGISAFERWY